MKLLLITALATIALTVDLPADRWNPPVSLDELPEVAELPKLFEFAASHQAVTADNWLQLRRELGEEVGVVRQLVDAAGSLEELAQRVAHRPRQRTLPHEEVELVH